MENKYQQLTRSDARHLTLNAAIKTLEDSGRSVKRLPGRGQSSVYEATNNGSVEKISIRTTRGRRFAFPSTNQGKEWLTLDDVDAVVVAAVDDREDPRNIQVYKFDADEVRRRFSSAYSARKKAGMSVRDNFGLWVSLDKDSRDIPRSVGTGLGDDFPPIAEYSIDELIGQGVGGETSAGADEAQTISDVVRLARSQIAVLAGVGEDAVKLDLKIEY